MTGKLIRKDRGFTIIEVMIVLAIAGLILAIVFLAVPSLDRSARNNSRKNDATHLAGIVSEYASNNAGTLPTGAQLVTAASGEHWAIMSAPVASDLKTNTASYGSTTDMNVDVQTTCDPTTNSIIPGASTHSFSIGFQVETSSGTQNLCVPGG